MIKKYFLLTKPGIIIGNLITAAAGFFLASSGHFNWVVFFGLILGTAFIIGASCVVNNYLDRGIDERMERTRNRAFVKHQVTFASASIFAAILGILGFLILFYTTNLLTVEVGVVGVFFYVVMYSIWKRKSSLSTIIGSVSGAVPPLAGYTAVSNRIDTGAVILFLILTFWQMPHFYSIGIFRLKDYTNANLPILPVKNGIEFAKKNIILYIIAFMISCSSLTIFGYAGIIFLVVSLVGGIYWFKLGLDGFKTKENDIWARKMFKYSLRLITIVCLLIIVESLLKNVVRF